MLIRAFIALAILVPASAVAAAGKPAASITEADVRATMTALASPEMRGRGSATDDERRAAEYVAARLKAMGLEPAGDKGSFLQVIELRSQAFIAPPTLSIGPWQGKHGAGFAVAYADGAEHAGPLQRWKEGVPIIKGAVVLLPKGSRAATTVLAAGAEAAIYDYDPRFDEYYPKAAAKLPELPLKVGNETDSVGMILMLDPTATAAVAAIPEGAPVRFAGQLGPQSLTTTRNVLGVIQGQDLERGSEIVMLSAHIDGLGVDPRLVGDQVFDGADDDASGVAAVLELTRVLAAGPKPKRTVLVALFGAEEMGLIGSRYFLDHPPRPLARIVANLEFEMIGRQDPKVAPGMLWLTGYTLSDLGPRLAAQGAQLVDDPHPEEKFFTRSDNFALVQRGVIAHTVSSFGLHPDYHQVTDDLEHIDFKYMTGAIVSLQAPLRWLVDSDFTPKWNEGMKP